jgi:hypothetical protein
LWIEVSRLISVLLFGLSVELPLTRSDDIYEVDSRSAISITRRASVA